MDVRILSVSVIDTGIGIKDSDLTSLFQQFGTIDNFGELNNKGIGLGLVISQKIVNTLGGKITV